MDEPVPDVSNIAAAKTAAAASVSSSSSKVIVSGGKREWIPSKERLQAQAQQQPPRQERRSEDSFSTSSAKSNDWFDERTTYDAYSTTDSSSKSRSTRVASSPRAEADRLDSERILNELLMDLDSVSPRGSSSNSDSGIDYFDFSVDSEDVRSSSKSRQTSSRAPAKTAPASSTRNMAPKMEDFASFEQYLDALVSHEKTAFSGGGGTSWDNSKKNVAAGRDFDTRGGSSSRDLDALDDNLVAFLGGDDDDSMGRGSRGQQNSYNTNTGRSSSSDSNMERSNTTPSPKVRSWNPQPSVPVSNVREELSESFDDDLDSFLDSLEDSNVLPPKTKVANLVVKKVEKEVVAVKSTPVVEQLTSSPVDFASFTVKDLKEKLKERGMPVSGSKAELVARLYQK